MSAYLEKRKKKEKEKKYWMTAYLTLRNFVKESKLKTRS